MNNDIITKDTAPLSNVERYLNYLNKLHRLIATAHVDVCGDTAEVIQRPVVTQQTDKPNNNISKFLRKRSK